MPPKTEPFHPIGVDVECPACGALTIESWPYEHCYKCGNRKWPDAETTAETTAETSEASEFQPDAEAGAESSHGANPNPLGPTWPDAGV